jgi:hypothetical protein
VSVNFCGCCVQDTVVCSGGPDRGMAAWDQHRGQLARRDGLLSPGGPSSIAALDYRFRGGGLDLAAGAAFINKNRHPAP